MSDERPAQTSGPAHEPDPPRDSTGTLAAPRERTSSELARDDELPIVARMVVEIRSDGLRTVARGALEDAATGQRVSVQARGTTPIALAASLAKSMFSAPVLARQALKALVSRKR